MELQKKDKQKIQTEQQVFHILINIIESYPQYTFAQHLSHILRKKADVQASYFWEDNNLLKKVEDYYDELKNES